MTITFEEITQEHIDHLSVLMKDADKEEVAELSDWTPYEALVAGWELSEWSQSVMIDGQCEAMFGVMRQHMLSDIVCPWFLSTEKAVKMKKSLLRLSRDVVQCMRKEYGSMRNIVNLGNDKSIRWLKWLGFTVSDPINVAGIGQCHVFEMEREL